MSQRTKRKTADRASVRAVVVPTELRGIMTRARGEGHEPFLLWDVGEDGIGLLTTMALAPGELVKVTLGEPFLAVLECRVKWCQLTEDRTGYRCGIQVNAVSRSQLQSIYEWAAAQGQNSHQRAKVA